MNRIFACVVFLEEMGNLSEVEIKLLRYDYIITDKRDDRGSGHFILILNYLKTNFTGVETPPCLISLLFKRSQSSSPPLPNS